MTAHESATSTLTRVECEAWITGHAEARLGFDTGRGRRSVVVTYTAGVDEILLVLPEYHPATGYVVGSSVTLEVEAARSDGRWECVRASGVAYGSDGASSEPHPRGASWPSGVATHAVRVPLDRVEGVVRAA